jgi:hypothetical protein
MSAGSSHQSSLKEVAADNVHIHPNFETYKSDFTVSPICLPIGIRKKFDGQKLILTGWGNINAT